MRRCEHFRIVGSAEDAAFTLRSSCLAGAVGWAGAHLSGPRPVRRPGGRISAERPSEGPSLTAATPRGTFPTRHSFWTKPARVVGRYSNAVDASWTPPARASPGTGGGTTSGEQTRGWFW